MPFAGTVADLDLIPNFAGDGKTVSMSFPQADLIPQDIENRPSNYVVDKSKYQFTKDEDVNPGLSIPHKSRPKNWAEYEEITSLPQFDRDNHPLYKGSMTPLLNGDFSGKATFHLQ